MNRSVDQIRREARLRDRIEEFLDAETKKPDFPGDPLEIRQRILAFVGGEDDLRWTQVKPGPYPKLLFPPSLLGKLYLPVALVIIAALYALVRLVAEPKPALWITGGIVAAVAVLVAAGLMYLNHLSATDPVIVSGDVKEHTAQLVETR
jgi:hypothetical protein